MLVARTRKICFVTTNPIKISDKTKGKYPQTVNSQITVKSIPQNFELKISITFKISMMMMMISRDTER